MKGLFSRKFLTLGLGLLMFAAFSISAQADTPPPPPGAGASIDTSMCSAPEVSQPFLFAKDNHFYTLLHGQSEAGFTGDGWLLRGGAEIVESVLPDGTVTQALSIPSGGEAVSPTICVNHEYPIARTMVRNAKGGDGVNTFISYEGTKTWEEPKASNKFHGNSHKEWTLSSPINLQPSKSTAWQRLRLLFVGGGKESTFEVYDFYVDPRMSR